jgi:hypothetical protein
LAGLYRKFAPSERRQSSAVVKLENTPAAHAVAPPQKATWREGFATNQEGGYTRTMDFDADIREQILARLPRAPEVDAEISAMATRDLLTIYVYWLSRLISPQPRQVHKSKVLLANPLATDTRYAPGLHQIISRVTNGEDITPHLSKDIRTGYQSSSASTAQRRKDLDLMLSDWGIHHLHLSTEMDTDGFYVKRDRPLLFAAFRPADAYLIDIADHKSWTRVDILSTIVEEWPDAGIVHKIDGLTSPSVSGAERQRLRDAGIGGAMIEINDATYSPAALMSTAGLTFDSVRSADKLLSDVTWFRDQITKSGSIVASALVDADITLPPSTDLHFTFLERGYGAVDRNTGFVFRLSL